GCGAGPGGGAPVRAARAGPPATADCGGAAAGPGKPPSHRAPPGNQVTGRLRGGSRGSRLPGAHPARQAADAAAGTGYPPLVRCGGACMMRYLTRRVVMLGTAFETRGGISSVVNVYREHG